MTCIEHLRAQLEALQADKKEMLQLKSDYETVQTLRKMIIEKAFD